MAQQKKIPHGATGVHRIAKLPRTEMKARKVDRDWRRKGDKVGGAGARRRAEQAPWVGAAPAIGYDITKDRSPGEQMVDSIKRGSEDLRRRTLHQIADVKAAQQRQRRDRAPSETRGKGEHFGKTLTHSQIVQPTNATAANRPRVDFGRTKDLSSSGGNPANVNHRPMNRKRGTTAQSVQARKEEMFLSGVTAKAPQYIKS